MDIFSEEHSLSKHDPVSETFLFISKPSALRLLQDHINFSRQSHVQRIFKAIATMLKRSSPFIQESIGWSSQLKKKSSILPKPSKPLVVMMLSLSGISVSLNTIHPFLIVK